MSKSKITRIREHSAEMYQLLNNFQRAIFVNGGQPDDIMDIAKQALRIVREIELDLDTTTNPPTFK